MYALEIFEDTKKAIIGEYECFWSHLQGAEKEAMIKDFDATIKQYIKRFLLLIDSRYSDVYEIKRIVDSQNESRYYVSSEHLDTLYNAAKKISDGKRRGQLILPAGMRKKMLDIYRSPIDRGLEDSYMPFFSQHFRLKLGQMNIITGIPSHGKSEFLDQYLVDMALAHKITTAIFSPENYPIELHIIKLASKILNKPFYRPNNRMTEEDLHRALDYIQARFIFLEPYENDVSLESLLSLVLEAKEKNNISAFVFDPWNEIEHNIPANKTEVQYIGESLTKIRRFGRKHNISPFIVAHPTKLLPNKPGEPFPVPTAYNINGGAMWYNKADNILTVYRNEDDTVSVYVQKIKFKQYGKKGVIDFDYSLDTGRYTERENNI